MQLYLVQHGAAKNEAEDPQRRLTAEGTLTVERTADAVAGASCAGIPVSSRKTVVKPKLSCFARLIRNLAARRFCQKTDRST
jgi:phosphohistidine phosphatase SixA